MDWLAHLDAAASPSRGERRPASTLFRAGRRLSRPGRSLDLWSALPPRLPCSCWWPRCSRSEALRGVGGSRGVAGGWRITVVCGLDQPALRLATSTSTPSCRLDSPFCSPPAPRGPPGLLPVADPPLSWAWPGSHCSGSPPPTGHGDRPGWTSSPPSRGPPEALIHLHNPYGPVFRYSWRSGPGGAPNFVGALRVRADVPSSPFPAGCWAMCGSCR